MSARTIDDDSRRLAAHEAASRVLAEFDRDDPTDDIRELRRHYRRMDSRIRARSDR